MNESIRNWFDWRGWVVLISAIAVVFGVAAILSPALRDFVANATTAAWASAVSTFLAAAIALVVATSEMRSRRTEQTERAALYAAHLSPFLDALVRQLRQTCQIAGFSMPLERSDIQQLQEDLRAIEVSVDIEKVLNLVPLRRHAAHRIAAGVATAAQIKKQILNEDGISQSSAARIEDLIAELMNAVEMILTANETCTHAAASHARQPTADEVHGAP